MSENWRDEDERIRVWRWVGGGMSPGSWQMGPVPEDAGDRVEIAFFVAEARAAEERDQLRKAA